MYQQQVHHRYDNQVTLTPETYVRLSGVQATFIKGVPNANVRVSSQMLQSRKNAATVVVSVGSANLSVSIRRLCSVQGGVAWIRVSRRQSSGAVSWLFGKTDHANMEVFTTRVCPPEDPDYDVLALIKLEDESGQSGWRNSEEFRSDDEVDDDHHDDDDDDDGEFEISVRFFNGKPEQYIVHKDMTVDELKNMIYIKHMYPPQEQKLLFMFRELQEGTFLSSYGIQANSTLFVVQRLFAG
ncbi:ubiquitin-60S ribosomal protein l40 [Plakobranchus ocellatus]|uniref:Ubiquitin-60S ribosomal protein l40 n=1 Tax=Plakobranchus ocellatus TaxID=259542 RepID=A0AAV3Y018_9GAST|nr:ubiquitin-60S ribosomal protein l40 [Plakobranchus ocellatus]